MAEIGLTLSGASDDILVVNVDGTLGEIYPTWLHDENDVAVARYVVTWKGGRCNLTVVYDGCWSFAVSKVGEDDGDLPEMLTAREGYTEVLELKVKGKPVLTAGGKA